MYIIRSLSYFTKITLRYFEISLFEFSIIYRLAPFYERSEQPINYKSFIFLENMLEVKNPYI